MRKIISAFFLSALLPLAGLANSEQPVPAFTNPHLAASSYPVVHSRANVTPFAGPLGPSRQLRDDEIKWQPAGPVNAWVPVYSGPYPNGKRVIWVGGYDRVSKLDADTLDVLTTYAIGGNTYFGDDEVRRHLATMDQLDDEALVDYNLNLWSEPFPAVATFYRLLTKDNELFFPRRAADGSVSLQVYGEVDSNDPSSKILLRREWKIPQAISQAPVFGINMTSDGWIILVTQDGTLISLSLDLKTHHSLKLPGWNKEKLNSDMLSSFVRNGLSTDDKGGIYVVTRNSMHRVQWTGEKLSLDETDGAWSTPYPNENGLGSGTTPGLMGWGDNEDHLVIIADGTRSNNMLALWRDDIPKDWKGLPGLDRRIAGTAAISFGVADDEQVQIENSSVIYGYGVFFDRSYFPKKPSQNPTRQWLAEAFRMHTPNHEAKGGTMLRWDPQTRQLKTAWRSPLNFASTVCTVSAATEQLYCWGNRDRKWVLEGINWHSGESLFHYTLGKSHRYNPMGGGLIVINPDGAIDCGCPGGLGIVRIRPKEKE